MNRRDFLQASAVGSVLAWLPQPAWSAADYRKLLILIELKGGNDGLNTVIPYADPQYAALRPRLAIARDQVLQLDDYSGFHPGLSALMPLWKACEMAVVQGVGYPSANLSHFRSIEIWDTAAESEEYLQDGWLTRAFAADAVLSLQAGLAYRRSLLLAWAAAALGLLTKGLIGVVLPGGVIIVWLLTERRLHIVPRLLWWPAPLLFALIAAPWFVLMQHQHPGFVHYFFIHQQFQRFTAGGFNNMRVASIRCSHKDLPP